MPEEMLEDGKDNLQAFTLYRKHAQQLTLQQMDFAGSRTPQKMDFVGFRTPQKIGPFYASDRNLVL